MKDKGSVYAHLFTETPEGAELFDRWLDERETDLDARKADAKDDEAGFVDAARLEQARGGYDGNIAAGQIRILSKRYTEDPWTPPFVAVLEKWHEGMWLVAPFSPYGTPASPGEMSTGMHLLGRETIQAWNARTVQERLLAKSFLCGELDTGTLDNALALFRNQMAGTPLPEGFGALRGPEILLASDPRREHLAESIWRLRPLSTAVRALERALAEEEDAEKTAADRAKRTVLLLRFRSLHSRRPDAELLAAGTILPTVETFRVDGGVLDVERSPESGMATLTFYGEDGNPTTDFDGYGVMGAGLEFLGTVGGGALQVPVAAVEDGFRLVDPDGMPLDVEEGE